MRCSKCGTDNAEDARFCNQCATALNKRCPKCGGENAPQAKFCSQCAAPFGPFEPAPSSPELHEEIKGERRHLTVLFCDLVGSTEIAASLDPEEWREIDADYQRAAAEAVERFGGHVAKFLGDGVMAYFGWPQAHDNDAERGVRAGLAILDAINALNGRGDRPKLSARIGIHTGSVVVGTGGGPDADIFGDAPNLASRVQTAADPGTVLITAETHRLVSGMFVGEERGAHQLKGIAAAVDLYRVIQQSGARGRLAASATRGLTPFVGREEELRLLWNRWERVLDGEGQVVLIAGEAGIGKSRLVQQFHERLAGTPRTWVESASAPYFQNTPFYAVADMLQQAFGWRGDESAEEKLNQLERNLEAAGPKLAEAVRLIAPLLNVPVPEKYPPLLLSPEQQRRRLLATLAGWVFGAARAQATAIVLEDMHWVDPSTMELLQILVDQGATAPLLLLYTARPEFRAPWPMREHHAQLTLNRLSKRNVRAIITNVAARTALSDDVVETLVNRTGGVPLFAEELTRLLLEGDRHSVAHEIPATLADSLMARLDRLGPAKEVSQLAAVIGHDFSYELLHAVSSIPEDELQSALAKLADAELIYARGIPPEATYHFKHALIQDAAYEALLKTRRKELHRDVARAIAEKFHAMAEAQPEVLARHWTEAGEAEPAIAAWRKAGDAAIAHRAYKEAQEPYQQALAMLSTLPESPERDARELELMSALADVFQVTRGYTAPEFVEATVRARALAEKSGNLGQLVLQVSKTCNQALIAGEIRAARTLADEVLDLAQREGSPASLVHAHDAQQSTRYYGGDLVGSEEHFVRGSAFFEAAGRFRVSAFGTAAYTAWFMGRADTARERIRQATAAALNSNSPFHLASAQFFAAVLKFLLREPKEAETLAAQVVAISDEHGFPWYAAYCRIYLGWARAHFGRTGAGVALIRQGLATLAEIGTRVSITLLLICLAEAQALDGATADALGTIEEALEANSEVLLFRPEALRVRGELRLRTGRTELAEADFREAITLARKMGVRSWQLRATVSLARLLAKQDKRDEGRNMLSEIYGWFTEGSDTADLKDAKALLDELST